MNEGAEMTGSARRTLREILREGTHAVPGVFNAAAALLAERAGFQVLYVSGAATANGVAGLPDVGLLGLEEVARHARYTVEALASPLPVIVDADTGFGDSLVGVLRTVREFEAAGVAAIHLEDQATPKRCGHLSGKTLIPPEGMAERIRLAVDARTDPEFVIIARTDARGVEGLGPAIERAHAYLEAGADAIFPEGLASEEEFAAFARAVPAPLVANMTEFGKTPLLSVAQFAALGYRLVLFPLTAFRVAMKAVESALAILAAEGTQASFIDRMQTRDELYDLVRYEQYAALDARLGGYR